MTHTIGIYIVEEIEKSPTHLHSRAISRGEKYCYPAVWWRYTWFDLCARRGSPKLTPCAGGYVIRTHGTTDKSNVTSRRKLNYTQTDTIDARTVLAGSFLSFLRRKGSWKRGWLQVYRHRGKVKTTTDWCCSVEFTEKLPSPFSLALLCTRPTSWTIKTLWK